MKTAFKLILLLALLVYLCFAFTRFSNTGSDATCEGVHVIVADSTHAGFITADEVLKILDEAHIDPVGKPMKDIVSKAIEDTLLKNSFVREATCYKTPANKVNILVEQRLPLMRIMADNGDDYYLDENGFAMDAQGYVANLVVATGDFDRDFARHNLVKIGRFLRNDPVWDDQIEQIYVNQNLTIDLVPRVGNHVVHLGDTDSLSLKMRNLAAFYQKAMPQVGWNKYKEVNIADVKQIVCTKDDKHKR